mmetsp:Transcript_19595/g.60599  ORF Transcript_19595/g.60599 Transcript_19595/m.60599 type:complete len:237 (-) Transcript_19595:651-1361(-)
MLRRSLSARRCGKRCRWTRCGAFWRNFRRATSAPSASPTAPSLCRRRTTAKKDCATGRTSWWRGNRSENPGGARCGRRRSSPTTSRTSCPRAGRSTSSSRTRRAICFREAAAPAGSSASARTSWKPRRRRWWWTSRTRKSSTSPPAPTPPSSSPTPATSTPSARPLPTTTTKTWRTRTRTRRRETSRGRGRCCFRGRRTSWGSRCGSCGARPGRTTAWRRTRLAPCGRGGKTRTAN